jgi:tetratricopeptide (TPR) repeat protein
MPSLTRRCINTFNKVALYLFVMICSSSFLSIYGQATNQRQSGQKEGQKSGKQISDDDALKAWESKQKYFIVVAANKSARSKTDLPFAKVDGTKVKETLRKLGYTEIATLPDKHATLNNFVAILKTLDKNMPDNSIVVVYYSGHGAVDPKGEELWLQLYGQDTVGWGLGLSLSNLVKTARNSGYEGELAVIIDACYSGQGALASALTLRDLKDTTIFTSSSEIQESYSINVDKIDMSAFTHFLLEGLTAEWDAADDNKDGILQFEELRLFIKNNLTKLYTKGIIDEEMTPYIVSQQSEMIAAYDPAKVKNRNTLLREALSLSLAIKNNPTGLLQDNKVISPPLPSARAREIARLIPKNADSYALALKAIAEGRNDEARQLLEEAEKNKKADLAEIYQARGQAEIYDGNFLEGIKWLQKALQASSTENVELLEETAAAMFMVSDIAKAEELFNRAMVIRQKYSKKPEEVVSNIFFLALINFYKGDFNKAEFYFRQLQEKGNVILDDEDINMGLFARLFLGLINITQEQENEAELLIKNVLATPETELKSDDPVRVLGMFLLSSIYLQQGKNIEAKALLNQFIALWEKALNEGDVDTVSSFVAFAAGFGSGSSAHLSVEAGFEMLCKRSRILFEKEINSNNPAIASSLTNLGIVYKSQGKYSEAEASFKEALEIFEETVGPSNSISLATLTALGNLYFITERYTEAEQVFKHALNISEGAFGGQGILVLTNIEDLGHVYVAQKRYQEAEAAYSRALYITKSIWGADNPMITSVLEHLASSYTAQKKYSDAEKLYKQGLTIAEKSFGSNHDEVIDSLINLAQLYRVQERIPEAEQFYKKALTIYELNGGRARHLAAVLYNLGQLSEKQQKESEAETYYKRAIATDEKTLGMEDPEVATDLIALASFYRAKGKLSEATPLFSRALYIREKAFGQDHPNVAAILTSLGSLYYEQKRYDEAESLLIRAIKIWEKTPKPKTHEFVNSLWWAGTLYRGRGNYQVAASFFERVLSLDESHSPPDLLNLARDLETLGMIYFAQGERTKAASAFIRSISIQEQAANITPKEIIYSFIGLTIIHQEQGEKEKAVSFHKRALEIIRKVPQPEQSDTIKYLEEYASLLHRTNRPMEAKQLGTFAKEISEHLKKSSQ